MPSQSEQRPRAVGAKQTARALRAGKAVRVFLARDADPAVTGPVEALCREQSVETVWFDTMKELGRDCGIAVGAAVAAATRSAEAS